MNKKPQSYIEWLQTAGEAQELGNKILVTYTALRHTHRESFTKAIGSQIMDAFERALFDKGYKPVSLILNREEDAELRAREIVTIMDAKQGSSLEAFSGKVFADAQNFYNQVEIWENKTLWQYIKWWFRRKF